MNYIEQFLGKKAEELTYQDIENFFKVEQEENDKLEFKSYQPIEKDKDYYYPLLECICGFLNSSGGLLVWGAPSDSNKKVNIGNRTINIKSCVGDLKPVDFLVPKEAFINKVTTKITPSPKSIRFITKENEGKYVYLIEVDESAYSPHQFDGKYPMRLDAATISAPHHYIEALFNKVKFPLLLGSIKHTRKSYDTFGFHLDFDFKIENKSKLLNEEKLSLRIEFSGCIVYSITHYCASNINHSKALGGFSGVCESSIFYGMPFILTLSTIVRIDASDFDEKIFSVIMYFGGKSAPLKKTQNDYILKVDGLNSVSVKLKESHENISFYENE